MATGKRYYWLKLKRDFMFGDEVEYMMSQPDGAQFVMIYLMLCFAAINSNGALLRSLGEMIIPFDIPRIQRECRYFDESIIEKAVELYSKIGLIYEDQNGAFVIANFDNMVGSTTDFADQKRRQRAGVDKGVDKGVDNVHADTRDQIPEYRDQMLERRERTTTTDSAYIGDPTGGGAGGGGDLPPEILSYAREAARGAKNPAAYEAAVLDRIRAAGYRTIEEVRKADQQRKQPNAQDQQPKRIGGETIL